VTLSQRVRGIVTQVAGPVSFNVVLDPQAAQNGPDQSARWQFQKKLQALRREIAGALELANSTTRENALGEWMNGEVRSLTRPVNREN
jgi:hypothetical protein